MSVVNEKEGRNLTKLSISMSMSAAPILVALILSSSFLLAPAKPSNNASISRRLAGQPGALDEVSREYLAAHNKIRQSQGEPPLQWDQNLTNYACNFALKRVDDCKMIHSYGPYGENIFWGEQNHWKPTEIVDMWASEKQYYDAATNECAPEQMCGHYTQLVWLDTTRVGCANVTCKSGGMYAICSYDPPGNYVNESPFKRNIA